MDGARAARIGGLNELVQFRDERSALSNRNHNIRVLLHETELSRSDVKRSPQPIIPVGSSDALNGAIPLEPADALQTLTNNRFFVINLAFVSNVLPMTTARCAQGFLPIR